MDRRTMTTVPHGYEPPAPSGRKGSLIYYDDFEHAGEAELERALAYAEERSFEKLVLYPLHEETVRRLSKTSVAPFYKREDRLHEWKRERGGGRVAVEGWEGKRKKYTPIDAALRHLAGQYPSPLFLYMTPDVANAFASFSTFEEWISKLRIAMSE
ncbi:hypothetical protein MO973_00685 [Paenibacillus sp. TRM 82003]|nr:hypothetical protein [Paenibacillus sp. TRM 82003]